MRYRKFLLLVVGMFVLSGCENKIVEEYRLPSPNGSLEAVVYEDYSAGEFRLEVTYAGEEIIRYPALAIRSDQEKPFTVRWLSNCSLLAEIQHGAVRSYVSTLVPYCDVNSVKPNATLYVHYKLPEGEY